MYYYSKSPAVSMLGLSLAPLDSSTFNRVYRVKKGGRFSQGPVVAGAAIVMHNNIIPCSSNIAVIVNLSYFGVVKKTP